MLLDNGYGYCPSPRSQLGPRNCCCRFEAFVPCRSRQRGPMGADGGEGEQASAPSLLFQNIRIEENNQILIKAIEYSLN